MANSADTGINGTDFQSLLDEAVAFHGHLCGGQIVGVKMAMAGLREIGLNDPRGEQRKDIIVFVEIDRCATDAIIAVTGCRPGRRSLKLLDHGKMAATFVNLKTGKAVRINATAQSRRKAEALAANLTKAHGEKDAFCQALLLMPEEELFTIREVSVSLKAEDLPGETLGMVVCDACGENVLDLREVRRNGKSLCRPCAAGKTYYQPRETGNGS